MKSYKFSFYSILAIIVLFPFESFSQLNGNYTINPRTSASSSNYRNWASAISDMLSGTRSDGGTAQGSGISGPVTFTVYDTIYNNTYIELSAISGASYTNRITFKSAGGDSSKCILKFASSSSSTTDYVLLLNGADYITFQEIGFERTGSATYSTVVQIMNDADNNKFLRCFFKGYKMPSSSSLGFTYGIGSCIFFSGNGDSTQIIQNEMLYGYNGIYSVQASTANTISSNNIDTSGCSGIYMTSQTSLKILGNRISMGDFGTGKGHYVSYGFRIETSPSLIAAYNKIYMLAKNGQVVRAIVLASMTSSSTTPAMIYNNWVVNSGGTNDCTGLAVYASNYLNFYYNNVLITNSLANGAAYYHYATYTNTYIRLQNNNLINKGGGYAYNVPGTNTADLDSVNYNNIYTTGSYIGNWGGTNHSSFSSWKSNSGKDANSTNVDPGYISNNDLHVSNISLNGKALYDSRIKDDIEKDTRDNSTPDIGADEFFPVTLDAGIANLDSPILFCAGKQNIMVTFQNYGLDTIKNVEINWQINGTTQTPYSWNGKLSPGSSATNIKLGTYTFSGNTPYLFKIWTQKPNNSNDGKNSNDTLKISRMAALSGNYNIDDSSWADFKSFNEAITAMTDRGICGAINFKVYPATYTEQITLVQLQGMGSTNPVTFENVSNDSTKVIVTHASTTATGNNNAALQLRGADYVTFKGITFERTGTNTYAHVLHILNGSNNNTFSNCRFLGLPLIAANANAMNIWSDQTQDNYNKFINNYIKDGNMSVSFAGVSTSHETGNVFDGNIIEGAYGSAVQISYNDKLDFSRNILNNVTNAIAGNYDVQLLDCDSNFIANANYFKDNNSETSLLITGCHAASNKPSIISNNFISKYSTKGISIDGANNLYIAFNSIYFYGPSTGNSAILSSTTTSSNITIKNNNILVENGYVFYINTPSQIAESNYNNLYSRSSTFAYWGTTYNNLSDLKAGSGKDAKSFSIDPFFNSSIDLHIKNPLMKNSGVAFAKINTDFDGDTRDTINPDIGADEFQRVPNDAGMINITEPTNGKCVAAYDVVGVIKNYGRDTLKTSTIYWSVNGNSQTPVSWKGSLLTNQTDTFTLGNYNFLTLVNPQILVKSSSPNGNIDEIKFNDSIIVSKSLRALPPANAGPDIGICPGDSIFIGPGSGSGYTYKWTDLNNNVLGNTSLLLVKPKVTTMYILEVTSINYGCKKSDTIEVKIHTNPNADAGKDQTICRGKAVKIGENSQSGINYSWKSSPAGFTSYISNPTVYPYQTTTYFLEKTINATGCMDLDTVVITVNTPPTPKIQGTSTSCLENTFVYFTTYVNNNNYKWIIDGGTIESGQNTSSIYAKWTKTGTAMLKVIETTPNNCIDSAIMNINVFQKANAGFTFKEACLGNYTDFNNISTDADSYKWMLGDGNTSNAKNISHKYPSAKTYTVTLIAQNTDGCNDTLQRNIYVFPNPLAKIAFTKGIGNSINFIDSSTIDTGKINFWKWYFGDGDSSTDKNPTHNFSNIGKYKVKLCVTSNNLCENCAEILIDVLNLNTFKPSNQIIYPNPSIGNFVLSTAIPVKESEIEIFDILGVKLQTQVSQATSINTYNVKFNASDGIYWLKFKQNGKTIVEKIIIKN
ncbi:MAG: PKD domain-containing protein [Bacteroidetes bacterium]|nr:PKD domain-containing protein [Bacteroidota bacterium]